MDSPNFLIGGAQKCGTTSLSEYVKQHPNICMSKKKEIQFFCWDVLYEKGIQWYLDHFDHCKNYNVVGEASPDYIYFPKIPKRIFEFIPNVKIIFVLRNPVDRAYSHYWHQVRQGWESLSFEKAIKKEKNRISKSFIHRYRYSYLDRGKYDIQLKKYLDFFSPEQILVIRTNELWKKRLETISKVFKFLEVDTGFHPADIKKKNVGGKPRFPFIYQLTRKKNPFVKPLPIRKFKKSPIEKIFRLMTLWINKYIVNQFNLKEYPAMNVETRNYLENYFKIHKTNTQRLIKKYNLSEV